jgi:hypothetical protein
VQTERIIFFRFVILELGELRQSALNHFLTPYFVLHFLGQKFEELG